jgi:NADPH:quinone reductase-like Zn-dependent oxidoreductase
MKVYTTLGDGIAALKLEERRMPAPGRNEVLVKMTAAALNFRDLLLINGVRSLKPTAPRIPVSDGVGVVVAVGDRVTRFRTDDRVASTFNPNWLDGECTPEKQAGALASAEVDGLMAEYRVFNEQTVVAVPSYLTDVEAATLPDSGVTAWNAVCHRSRVQRGERVLIQGTGGVSTFALLFVHTLGGEAIVLSSSDEKLEKARALGAAATINYRKVPAWEEEVLALTDGRGVDHVIEVVGGENLNRSLRAVRVSGRISFIGTLAGPGAHINTVAIAMKNIAIQGIYTGSREMFEEMNRFLASHQLRPVIDRTFAFSEFPEALTYLDSGKQFGKVTVAFAAAA